MISYIKGKILIKNETSVVIETLSGVGFEVLLSPVLLSSLPKTGEECAFYTYMNVKEDGVSLFGFENQDELEIFKLLITISGIGPKGALGILSALSPNELFSAVALGDVKTLSKSPGIGKKTAERLVLELKDKFSKICKEPLNLYEAKEFHLPSGNVKDEAAEALLSLGYTQKEAYSAINAVYFDGLDAETIIKRALSALNRL